VKFLVDAQLPPALARWLTEQGYQADHVEGCALRDADDTEIWNRAAEVGAVLVTKDEDFAARSARTPVGPKVVWLRVGNTTNPALMQWLTPRLPNVIALLDRGDTLVEVR
jgi:predicted nuclease of predicted toxin-antitoxin system